MYASKHFDFKNSLIHLENRVLFTKTTPCTSQWKKHAFPVLVSFLHHRNYVCPGSTPILTSDIQLALAKKLAKAIQNYC